MGARGCGKTTLLKMLTPASLHHWDSKHKTSKLSALPFIGVYIPTDIHWKKQLEQLKDDFENNIVEYISKGSVTINILVSLVKTFSMLLKTYPYTTEEERIADEIEICKLLIEVWDLKKPVVPNLDYIELHLLSIIKIANGDLKKIKIVKTHNFVFNDLLFQDFFDLVRVGCLAFEKKCTKFSTKRWALCFDELEIAPEWLQFKLLEYLRSRDQNIIFKLTTAPIISLIRAIQLDANKVEATENNDFAVIKIWTSNQKEFKSWANFCHKILQSRMSRKFRTAVDASEIFGKSDLERVIIQSVGAGKNDEKKNFQRDTPTWKITRQLAVVDSTFSSFLRKKEIDPQNPEPKNGTHRDQIFRKMKPLVVYRFQFRKGNQTQLRARKVIPLFYGIPLIYEMSDGNPRIFIDMIDRMMEVAQSANGQYRELTINEQSRIAMEASEKFRLVMCSHPDANITIRDSNVNLVDIIEKIGDYFHSRMVNDNFTLDPPGAFRVDEDINNKYVELLQLGLYLGAIVYLDSTEIIAPKGIIGKKFRLSYILSPYYGLLSREYKEVQLSLILNKGVAPVTSQQNLFKQ